MQHLKLLKLNLNIDNHNHNPIKKNIKILSKIKNLELCLLKHNNKYSIFINIGIHLNLKIANKKLKHVTSTGKLQQK
jgi:hypothetical protein